jgi:hypothetical protein
LDKQFAINLGIENNDLIRVRQERNRILIERVEIDAVSPLDRTCKA